MIMLGCRAGAGDGGWVIAVPWHILVFVLYRASGWVLSRGRSRMCFTLVSSRSAPCSSQGMFVGCTELQAGFGSQAVSDGPFQGLLDGHQMSQPSWPSVLPRLVISVEVSVVLQVPCFSFL